MNNKILALAVLGVLAVGAFIVVNDDDSGTSRVVGSTYTVTFDGNGGVPSVTSMTVVYGQPYGTLPTATRQDDYVFCGWNTAQDGSGEWIESVTIFSERSDITLYARYTILNWINYHLVAPGAENNPKNVYRYTKYQSIELFDPSCDGKAFDGWWVDPDYSIMKLTRVEGSEFPYGIDLYAKWN